MLMRGASRVRVGWVRCVRWFLLSRMSLDMGVFEYGVG
jgi:hypothetical protein